MNRLRMRIRPNSASAAVFGLLVVAAGIATYAGIRVWLADEGLPTYEASAADTVNEPASVQIVAPPGQQGQQPAESLRAPSPSECEDIERMLEAGLVSIKESYVRGAKMRGIGQTEIDSQIAVLDASAARSREWIANGCPPHPQLGVRDTPGGKSWEILDVSSIGR